MKILMIGNGFDLEHDLPTSYGSFLEFCNMIHNFETYDKTLMVTWINKFIIKNGKNDELIQDIVIGNFKDCFKEDILEEEQKKDSLLELYEYIHNNIWLIYFKKRKANMQENWIDLEKEISKVIQHLESTRVILSNDNNLKGKRIDKFNRSDTIMQNWIIERMSQEKIDNIVSVEEVDQISSILDSELERFIRAFEIYIDEIVNKLPITKKSKDIEKINPDFVLSFNYSNTYERVYGEGKDIQYDYIHGKADANKNIKTCNLVLGIDEYLEDDRKDTDLEFIAFKKYFQRIYKSTGNAYLKWVEKIKKDYDEYLEEISLVQGGKFGLDLSNPWTRRICIDTSGIEYPKHTLYIFGHSLDVTDRDILRLFICNDNVQTKIFYHQKDEDDKTTLGKLIKNLVRIMGQDELIRRTGGEHKTIEFIPQSKHEE